MKIEKKNNYILRGGPKSTVSKALSCNFCTWLRSRIFRIETVKVAFFTANLRESRHIFTVQEIERRKQRLLSILSCAKSN